MRPCTLALCAIAGFFLVSCMATEPLQEKYTYYMLEYAVPEKRAVESLPTSIEVSTFEVSSSYDRLPIVYRDSEYEHKTYVYQFWRQNPGDQLTDLITRDMRASKTFRMVSDTRSDYAGRFRIEGFVEEFFERDEPGGAFAVFSVVITLVDESSMDKGRRVLFQRAYHERQPAERRNPRAFVQAMSEAVQAFSAKLINDVGKAVESRLNEE